MREFTIINAGKVDILPSVGVPAFRDGGISGKLSGESDSGCNFFRAAYPADYGSFQSGRVVASCVVPC